MEAFSFGEHLNRKIWMREQSLRELLKKCYQLGFETGYESGFEQCLKELDKADSDSTSGCRSVPRAKMPRAILEAEQILREKSED